MTKSNWSRLITISGATLVALSLVLGLAPSPAQSATAAVYTARAEGEALELRLAGADLIDFGPRVADSTAVPEESGPTTGELIDLPLLADFLAAGVLAQDAAVDDAGNSAACSGLIGPGGQLNISEDEPPVCTLDAPTGPAGLIVNLTSLGLVRIRADAIYGECTASASGATTADAYIANAAIDVGVNLGIFGPVFFPATTIPIQSGPNTQLVFPPGLAGLNGLLSVVVNEQTPQPAGEIDVTALHVEVLGALGEDPLLDLEIGKAHCGPNTISEATIDFDTSGSLNGTDLQPQTENAISLEYTPGVDRPAITLAARLGPGVTADTVRGLPADCTLSVDGTTNPPTPVVLCQNVGPVDANETAVRVIPVEIEPDAPNPVTAELLVFGGSLAEVLSDPVVETADLVIESTQVSGDSGGLAVPNPNRTGLPNDILGTLYLSVPDYVEEAAYGGTPCTLAPAFAPAPSVYPAVPGNIVFTCGSAIAPPSEAALAFTYAADAPTTTDDGDLGRVLIIRGGQGEAPAEIPDNSYYSNLTFFVNQVPPPTTTTSTTAATTTSTSTPASTTSTTAASTTSSSTPASTTSTSTPASTTSSTAAVTTSSSTPDSTTSSSTPDSTTSSSVNASSSSTSAAIITSTTARRGDRMPDTGAANTRTMLSVAMGLVGLGMVVTGRGMQLATDGTNRRRRP